LQKHFVTFHPVVDTQGMQEEHNLLRSRRYALFWISSLFSNIGTWMQQVAQPWVVLTISNSSFWLGVDSFAMNAPGWVFTLWGGMLADKKDRRKIILFFQGMQLLCVIVLVALLVKGWLKVWMIIFISFLVGLTDALSMPSFQTIIPALVPKKDIPRAVALNSAQFNLSRILGPALAGVIMVKFGAVICYGANMISFVPFFLSLYWIYPKEGFKNKPPEAGAEAVEKVEGFAHLLLQREIRNPLITVLITTVFCSQVITFCPVIIRDIFHADASQFGSAMAAFGFGGIIGAGLNFVPLPTKFDQRNLSYGAALLMAIVVFFIAINHVLGMLTFLLILAGITLTVSNVAANGYLQRRAGDHIRGRVASLFQLAIHGGMSLGSLLTGFTSTQWGISWALGINAVVALSLQLCVVAL
jgi:MFS family permease